MLCVQGAELAKIETAIDELLNNRHHLELHEADKAMLAEALKVCVDVRATTATDEEMAAASDEYANDECEIDDEASASRADEGYWVSAWVWVPTPASECGQCEGTGTTDAMGFEEECPVCDGTGELKGDD